MAISVSKSSCRIKGETIHEQALLRVYTQTGERTELMPKAM